MAGGLFDVEASAIGAGAINLDQARLVMGSWSINAVITQDPIVDPNLFMTTLFAEPVCFSPLKAAPPPLPILNGSSLNFAAIRLLKHSGVAFQFTTCAMKTSPACHRAA